MDTYNVVRLPVRRGPADPVAEIMGTVAVRLFYLARDVRCLAAHAREPVGVLTMAEWMEDAACEFGKQAVGDFGDVDGG